MWAVNCLGELHAGPTGWGWLGPTELSSPAPGGAKGPSVLPLQLPNFINTTLPPHEQVTAQEIDSYFRQELIYKRNERMGRRVLALLQENQDKICFFAFGAGVRWSGPGICAESRGTRGPGVPYPD